jgi:hypothetical protein
MAVVGASAASAPPAARVKPCRPAILCKAHVPTLPTLATSTAAGRFDGYIAVGHRGAALVRFDGSLIWKVATPGARARPRLVAAGDFTGDRIPDYVFWILRAPVREQACGSKPMRVSHLLFVDGRSGRNWQPVAPLLDICWDRPDFNYPTYQWDFGTVYVGDFTRRYRGREVLVVPYYAKEGRVLNFEAARRWQTVRGRDGRRTFPYPSVANFDHVYNASNTTPCSHPLQDGRCFVPHSHVANGVFVAGSGSPNFLTLTSMRAVLYRADLTPTGDTTWIPGGISATLGRNYGLVDAYRNRGKTYVDLLGGCSVESMRRAMRASRLGRGWEYVCGIVRHFERFRVQGDTIVRIGGAYHGFSSTGGPLQGRLEFPANAHAAVGGRRSAWAVFNLFRNGRWAIVAYDQPDAVTPRLELAGWFVWDAADLDRDGRAELLASKVSRGYAAPWSFNVLAWTGTRFVSILHRDGVAPALLRYPNAPSTHTTEENIFGAYTRETKRGMELLVEGRSGRLSWLFVKLP